MKLEGRALVDGILFATPYKKVIGTIDDNGKFNIEVEKLTCTKNSVVQKIQHYIYKIPIIRGLYDMAKENKGMFIAAIYLEIMFYLLNLIMKSNLNINNELAINVLLGLCITLFIICIILIANTFSYLKEVIAQLKSAFSFHGAEHKAVNTLLAKKELTLSEVKKSSRISSRCGSNLLVFWLFILLILSAIFRSHFGIIFITAYSLAYELFNIKNSEKIFPLSLCYKLSSILQERILTKEPDEKQIQLAILTLKELEKTWNEA